MDIRIDEMVDVPAEWNFCADDPEAYERLKESVRKERVRQPVVVWAREDENGNETFMVLDGRRRVRANRELLEEERSKGPMGDERRYSHIPACIYEEDELTEEQAFKVFVLLKMQQPRKLIETEFEKIGVPVIREILEKYHG